MKGGVSPQAEGERSRGSLETRVLRRSVKRFVRGTSIGEQGPGKRRIANSERGLEACPFTCRKCQENRGQVKRKTGGPKRSRPGPGKGVLPGGQEGKDAMKPRLDKQKGRVTQNISA